MAIIGVMGSGSSEWPELAEPLGVWIACHGFDLLTGAGRGVMLSTARAFATVRERAGRSIGIVPSEMHPLFGFTPIAGYPNPFVDLPILTPLPRKESGAPDSALSRNDVNVLTSDVVIALPGSKGTLDEIRLATRFAKPLMCIGPTGAFEGVPDGTRIVSELDEVFAFIRCRTAAAQ
ncbi:DNA-binding protein [Burkholderia sp. Ac-20344]|uniref:SLOG cluster 4 domain-containing protein n=1 Tax=Burkholderia sp. Ac-20344 TaxID=2703890 RepID=UPI00197C1EB3|nr:DNA-binding protein [Burkholderia sp. Ac-20344]MBN3831887.1 DNA-binding protein [Burkholderia sp. Ac-20344]